MRKPDIHLVSGTDGTAGLFHSALRRLAGAVSIITAGRGGEITGATIGSLTVLSTEPPRLLINISRDSSVFPLIARHGWFGINILGSDQLDLADRFSMPHLTGPARFDGVAWEAGCSGVPLLHHAQAAIECEVDEIIERYEHAIIVGRPEEIDLSPRLSSLLYWNERYVEVDRNDDLDLLAAVGIPLAHVR